MIPYKGPQKDALWQFFQDVRKTMFVPHIPGFRLGKKCELGGKSPRNEEFKAIKPNH